MQKNPGTVGDKDRALASVNHVVRSSSSSSKKRLYPAPYLQSH